MTTENIISPLVSSLICLSIGRITGHVLNCIYNPVWAFSHFLVKCTLTPPARSLRAGHPRAGVLLALRSVCVVRCVCVLCGSVCVCVCVCVCGGGDVNPGALCSYCRDPISLSTHARANWNLYHNKLFFAVIAHTQGLLQTLPVQFITLSTVTGG